MDIVALVEPDKLLSMSGLNPGTVGAIVLLTIDQSQARRLGIDFFFRPAKSKVWLVFVYSQSKRYSQAFGPSIRPGHLWQGSNLQQKGPCRSQGRLASHCATDAPQSQKEIFVKTSARATLSKLISGF
ncbi:hypothetical protein PoB_007467300 [Plakobranchus ocellatus]|uniref:Uncharacterized protein n=1 Tax=Plakobranchus ocellatus TaxID=259542 RepID=A0AAV4DV67_9GAST|nr:hypothetical protein PoB_007467300 [Plakobranchus ocellatus]